MRFRDRLPWAGRAKPRRAPEAERVSLLRRLAKWRPVAITIRASMSLVDDGGFELAGHLAFTALIALFPFLIFLAALTGYVVDEDIEQDFVGFLFEFAPDDVAETLAPAVREVTQQRRGGLLTLGILGTLWAASSGVEALRLALNQAYNATELRSIWWRRLQSLLVVAIGAIAVLIVSTSVIIGPIVWDALTASVPDLKSETWQWTIVRYAIAAAILTFGLTALHQWLPNVRQPLRAILPGVLATTGLWLAMASLFSLYLGTVADYSGTYGSLGGVVITLLFFYASALIFIFGAEINRHIDDRRTERAPAAAGPTHAADSFPRQRRVPLVLLVVVVAAAAAKAAFASLFGGGPRAGR